MQGAKPEIDRYLVIHVATTCDEHGVYVTKDSAEVIEIGWLLLDAKNCEEVRPNVYVRVWISSHKPSQIHRESVLVKPVNTPITPLCSKLYSETLEIFCEAVGSHLISELDHAYLGACAYRWHLS